MGKKLNYDQKGRLSDRLDELKRVTKNGTRDFKQVMDMVQDMIDGKPLREAPSTDIVARVERQLIRHEASGVIFSDETRQRIMRQAVAFVPLSVTDRPLVTGLFEYAPEVINNIWPKVSLNDFEVVRYFDQDVPLRFASRMRPTINKVRLVHYDPNSYKGLSPNAAVQAAAHDGVRVAGIEVMEMIFVEPESALGWNGKDSPYPNLSGLELDYIGDDSWLKSPCIGRLYDGSHPRLALLSRSIYDDDLIWASPSIREC